MAGSYLKVVETAEILGISEKAVRRRIERGELPFRRWGRRLLISAAELESFLSGLPGQTVEQARAAVGRGSDQD